MTSFGPWLANLNMKRNVTLMFVNKKYRCNLTDQLKEFLHDLCSSPTDVFLATEQYNLYVMCYLEISAKLSYTNKKLQCY